MASRTLLLRRQDFDTVGGLNPDDRITGFDDAEFFWIERLTSLAAERCVPTA